MYLCKSLNININYNNNNNKKRNKIFLKNKILSPYVRMHKHKIETGGGAYIHICIYMYVCSVCSFFFL